MAKSLIISTLLLVCTYAQAGTNDLYNLSVETLSGPLKMANYKNKVMLIVNIASGCGYTPQLAGLQKLHTKYESKGLLVLGVPSNDFNQENLSDKKVGEFCKKNYGVEFPVTKKISVNGNARHPLYSYLIENDNVYGKNVEWNFEKFLVSRSGKVVGRFLSSVKPLSKELTKAIEVQLNASNKNQSPRLGQGDH